MGGFNGSVSTLYLLNDGPEGFFDVTFWLDRKIFSQRADLDIGPIGDLREPQQINTREACRIAVVTSLVFVKTREGDGIEWLPVMSFILPDRGGEIAPEGTRLSDGG